MSRFDIAVYALGILSLVSMALISAWIIYIEITRNWPRIVSALFPEERR